jgi:hypothetical protein
MYEIVVGRRKEDLEKYGIKCTGYIGKHIVGEAEEAHLTNPVVIDLLRPHVILISGKRGSGKSYSAGVIMEEIALLPEEFRKNLTVLVIDTMGIYWSTKFPNEQQVVELDRWGLKPKGLGERVKVYVPYEQKPVFEEARIPVDFGISIPPHEFSGEDWALAFNLPMTNPLAVALQNSVNRLKDREEKFSIDDLMSEIRDDRATDTHTKSTLESMLSVASQWGVFGEEGIRIEEIMKPGIINIFDVSRLRATEAWSVRNLLIALIARKVYEQRIIARKEEELAKMGEIELKERKPMVWLMMDECLPYESEIVTDKGIIPIGEIVKDHRRGKKIKVLAYESHTGKYGYYNVTNSFIKGKRRLLTIKTETGKILKCTPDHKILTKNGFVEAEKAREVALAKRYKNGIIFEKIIEKKNSNPKIVYDISVSDVHNFIANGFIVHNCHQFIPSDTVTVSTNPILTIVKQGREPGISFVPMTQMPNKVHQDVISQCDIVISHRLTSRDDIQALHAVMQTYMQEDIRKSIDSLPKWLGSAIILDDNSERIYNVQIRPRISWHAGEAAIAVL